MIHIVALSINMISTWHLIRAFEVCCSLQRQQQDYCDVLRVKKEIQYLVIDVQSYTFLVCIYILFTTKSIKMAKAIHGGSLEYVP